MGEMQWADEQFISLCDDVLWFWTTLAHYPDYRSGAMRDCDVLIMALILILDREGRFEADSRATTGRRLRRVVAVEHKTQRKLCLLHDLGLVKHEFHECNLSRREKDRARKDAGNCAKQSRQFLEPNKWLDDRFQGTPRLEEYVEKPYLEKLRREHPVFEAPPRGRVVQCIYGLCTAWGGVFDDLWPPRVGEQPLSLQEERVLRHEDSALVAYRLFNKGEATFGELDRKLRPNGYNTGRGRKRAQTVVELLEKVGYLTRDGAVYGGTDKLDSAIRRVVIPSAKMAMDVL